MITTVDSQVITQVNGSKYVQETIRITSDGIQADRYQLNSKHFHKCIQRTLYSCYTVLYRVCPIAVVLCCVECAL